MSQSQSTHPEFPAPQGPSNLVTRRSEQPISSSTNPPNQSSEEENSTTRFNRSTLSDSEQANIRNRSSLGNLADPRFNDNSDHHQSEAPVLNEILTDQKPFDTNSYNNPHYQQQLSHHSPSHHSIPKQSHSFNSQGTFDTNDLLNAQNHPSQTYPNPSDPIKSSNYQYPRLDQFNPNRYDLVHDKLSDYYHHSDTPSDPKPDVPKAHFELNRDLLDQSLVEDSNDQVLSTPHAGRGSSDHQDSPVPITVQVENPQQHLDQLFETSSTSSIDASHLSLPGNSPGQVGSEFHHLQGEGSHSGHSLLYDKHSLASTVQTEKQRGGRDQLSEGNLQVGQTTTQVAEELPRSEKSESTLPSTTEVQDLSKSAQSIHPTTDLQASPQLSFSSQISNSNVSSPESKKTTPLSKDSQFENQSRSPPLFESNPVGDSRAISNNPQETSSTHTRFYHFPPYSSPLNGQASPDVTDCKPEEDLSEEDSFQEGAKYEQNDYHLSDPSAAQEKPKRKFYFNPELANQTTVATGITSSSQDGWGTGETHQFDSVSTATEQTPLDGQALERKANENTLSNELDEHTQIVSEPSSSVDISMRSSVSTTNQAHQQQIDTTEQRSLPNSQHSIILHSSLPATHQLEKSSNLSQVEEPRNNTIANFNKPASYKDNEKRPDSPMTVQSETSQSFNPSQVAPEEPQLPKITKPLGREPPTSPNVLATDKKEDPSDVSRFGGSTFTLSSRPYLKSPFKSQSNLTERAVESDAMNSPQSDYINDHEQQAAQTSHDQPADYYEDDLLNQENFEMESVLDEEDFIPPADQSYALEMEDSQSSFSDEDPDCSYTGDVPTTQLSTITELSESVPEAHLSLSLLRSPLRQDLSSPLSSTIQHTSHLDNGPLSHSETSLVEPQDLIGTSSIPENAFTPDLDQGIPSQSDDLSRSQERSLQPHTKESPIPEGDVSSEGPNNVEQADSLGSAQLENTSAMEERGFTAVHSDVQSVDPSSTARASEDQAVQSTILQPDPVSARSEFQAEAELINNGVIDNPSSVPPPSPPGPIVANEPVPIETDRLGDSVMEHGINLPVEPAVTSDQLASGAQEHVPEKLTASTFQSPSQLHNAQVASTDATEEMVDTVSNSAEDDKSSSAEHQSTCRPQLHSLEILHQDTGPMVDSSVKDESPRSSIVTTHLVKNPRNLNQTEDLDKDDHLLQDTHLEETQSTVDSPTEDRSVQSVIVIDSPTEDPPTPYQSNDPAESSTATKLQLSPEVLDLQDEDCHPYKNPPLQVPIEDNPSQSINVEDDPMATAPTDDLDEKGDNSFVMTETSDSYSQLAHRDAVEDSPGHAVSNLEQTMEPELLSPQAESFEAQTEFPTTIKAVVLETSDSYSDTSRETTLLENPAPVPSACHMDPPNLVPVGHGLAEDSEMSFGDGPPSSTDSTHAPAAQSSHQEIPLADSAANLVEPVNVRNKEAEPNPTLEATESSTAPVAVSEAMHASEAELSPQDASLPEPSTSLTHEKAGQDQVESPPAMQVVESDVLPVDVTDAIHASDAHSSSAMSLSDSNGLIEIEEARQVHSSQEVSLSGSARSLVESEEVGQQAVESNFTEDITSSDIPQADISEVAQASDVEVSPQDAPLPDSVTSLAQPEKVGQGEVESILMTETTESGIPSVENTDAMQESDAQAVLNPLSALDPSAAQSESQTQAQLPLNDAVKKATTLSSERLCEHSAVEEAGLVETESLSDHVSDHEQRGSINPATLSHSKTGELLSDRVSDHLETAAEQPSSPDPLQMPSQSGDVGTQLSFSDTEDNTVEIRAEPAEEAVLQKEIDVNTAGPSEEPQAVVEVNDPPQDPRPKDEDHGSEHSSSSPIVTKAPHKQRSFVDQAKEIVKATAMTETVLDEPIDDTSPVDQVDEETSAVVTEISLPPNRTDSHNEHQPPDEPDDPQDLAALESKLTVGPELSPEALSPGPEPEATSDRAEESVGQTDSGATKAVPCEELQLDLGTDDRHQDSQCKGAHPTVESYDAEKPPLSPTLTEPLNEESNQTNLTDEAIVAPATTKKSLDDLSGDANPVDQVNEGTSLTVPETPLPPNALDSKNEPRDLDKTEDHQEAAASEPELSAEPLVPENEITTKPAEKTTPEDELGASAAGPSEEPRPTVDDPAEHDSPQSSVLTALPVKILHKVDQAEENNKDDLTPSTDGNSVGDKSFQSPINIDPSAAELENIEKAKEASDSSTATDIRLSQEDLNMQQHEDGHPEENSSTVSNGTNQKSHEPSIAEDVSIAAADTVDQAKEAEELAAAQDTVDSNQQAHPDETEDHRQVELSNSEHAVDPELLTPQTDSFELEAGPEAHTAVEQAVSETDHEVPPPDIPVPSEASLVETSAPEPSVSNLDSPPLDILDSVDHRPAGDSRMLSEDDRSSAVQTPSSAEHRVDNILAEGLDKTDSSQQENSALSQEVKSDPDQNLEASSLKRIPSHNDLEISSQISPQDTPLPDPAPSLGEPQKAQPEGNESTPTAQTTECDVLPLDVTDTTRAFESSPQEILLDDSTANLVGPEKVEEEEAEFTPTTEKIEPDVPLLAAVHAAEAEVSPQDIPLSDPAASLVEPDQVGEEQVDSTPTLETTEPAVPPVTIDETVMNEEQSSPQEIPLTDTTANLEEPEKVGEKELELTPTMQTNESDLPPVEVSEPIQASETQISPQDTLLPDSTESLVEPEKVEQELESTPTAQTIGPDVPSAEVVQPSEAEVSREDTVSLVEPENVGQEQLESIPTVQTGQSEVPPADVIDATKASESSQEVLLDDSAANFVGPEKVERGETESAPPIQTTESDVLPVEPVHVSEAEVSPGVGKVQQEEAELTPATEKSEIDVALVEAVHAAEAEVSPQDIPRSEPAASLVEPDQVGQEQVDSTPTLETTEPAVPPAAVDETVMNEEQSSPQEIPLTDTTANLEEPEKVGEKELELTPTMQTNESDLPPVEVSEPIQASETQLSPQDTLLPESAKSLVEPEKVEQELESPPTVQTIGPDVPSAEVVQPSEAEVSHEDTVSLVEPENVGHEELESIPTVQTGQSEVPPADVIDATQASESSQEILLDDSAVNLVAPEKVEQEETESTPIIQTSGSDVPPIEVVQASEVELSPEDIPLPAPAAGLVEPEKVGQEELESTPTLETTEPVVPPVDLTDTTQASDAQSPREILLGESAVNLEPTEAEPQTSELTPTAQKTEPVVPTVDMTNVMPAEAQAVPDAISASDSSAAQSQLEDGAELPTNHAAGRSTSPSPEQLSEPVVMEGQIPVETECLVPSDGKTPQVPSDHVSANRETTPVPSSSPDTLKAPSLAQNKDDTPLTSIVKNEMDKSISIRAEDPLVEKEASANTACASEQLQPALENDGHPENSHSDEAHSTANSSGSGTSASSPTVTKPASEEPNHPVEADEAVEASSTTYTPLDETSDDTHPVDQVNEGKSLAVTETSMPAGASDSKNEILNPDEARDSQEPVASESKPHVDPELSSESTSAAPEKEPPTASDETVKTIPATSKAEDAQAISTNASSTMPTESPDSENTNPKQHDPSMQEDANKEQEPQSTPQQTLAPEPALTIPVEKTAETRGINLPQTDFVDAAADTKLELDLEKVGKSYISTFLSSPPPSSTSVPKPPVNPVANKKVWPAAPSVSNIQREIILPARMKRMSAISTNSTRTLFMKDLVTFTFSPQAAPPEPVIDSKIPTISPIVPTPAPPPLPPRVSKPQHAPSHPSTRTKSITSRHKLMKPYPSLKRTRDADSPDHRSRRLSYRSLNFRNKSILPLTNGTSAISRGRSIKLGEFGLVPKSYKKRSARSEQNNDLSDAFAIIDISDATTYSPRADRYVNPTLGRRLSTSVKDILQKRQNRADLMKKSPLDDVHMAEDFHFDVDTQLANLPECHSEDEFQTVETETAGPSGVGRGSRDRPEGHHTRRSVDSRKSNKESVLSDDPKGKKHRRVKSKLAEATVSITEKIIRN